MMLLSFTFSFTILPFTFSYKRVYSRLKWVKVKIFLRGLHRLILIKNNQKNEEKAESGQVGIALGSHQSHEVPASGGAHRGISYVGVNCDKVSQLSDYSQRVDPDQNHKRAIPTNYLWKDKKRFINAKCVKMMR